MSTTMYDTISSLQSMQRMQDLVEPPSLRLLRQSLAFEQSLQDAMSISLGHNMKKSLEFDASHVMKSALGLGQTPASLRADITMDVLGQGPISLAAKQSFIDPINVCYSSVLRSSLPCPSVVPSHLSHILSHPSITPFPLRDSFSDVTGLIYRLREHNALFSLISIFENLHRLSNLYNLDLDVPPSQFQKMKAMLLDAPLNIKRFWLRKISNSKKCGEIVDVLAWLVLFYLPERYHLEILLALCRIIRIIQKDD